jgi:hypothetical protein
VKKLTFTYKSPAGTPEAQGLKGFMQTLCEIGDADSKCTSETIRYFEQEGSVSYGATAIDSSSGTKAIFRA